MNTTQRRRDLEEALEAMGDEITESTLAFTAALARLRHADKDSVEYDKHWRELAVILFQSKLKAKDADKLMEKAEALERLQVKT